MEISLTLWSMKKIWFIYNYFFPKPYSRGKNRKKVKLDYSYYVAKSDLKSVRHMETSKFAKTVI